MNTAWWIYYLEIPAVRLSTFWPAQRRRALSERIKDEAPYRKGRLEENGARASRANGLCHLEWVSQLLPHPSTFYP